MIDKIINTLFRWNRLRDAIFAEVHFYDQIKKAIDDPTPGALFWDDHDGWRSWSYETDLNRYYFNDIPEQSLSDAMMYSFDSI